MIKNFFKYQSLGNDFIILDWYKKKLSTIQKTIQNVQWNKFVKNICNRNFGIGADGILILKNNNQIIEGLIFNSDGSKAEICLNGVRCLALHFYKYYNENNIKIKMGNQIIKNNVNQDGSFQITSEIISPKYLSKKTIIIKNKKFDGHIVKAPNSHFIIFKKTNINEFKKYGPLIESSKEFKNKTNVEFVWKKEKKYPNKFNCLVHERGCGPTLACSSGASAIIKCLAHLKKGKANEKIIIQMPGGNLECWFKQNTINIKAPAAFVFKGIIK